jgi:NTP pyrophosphatase (non-canonical NTP hydrolase)
MTLDELEAAVQQWSRDRGIIPNATRESQLLKAVSEVGELADAVNKRQYAETIDAIGDVTVCLINLAYLSGSSLRECLELAYDEIKDRKGRLLPNGTFVKEVME